MAERFKFTVFDRDAIKAVAGGESDLKKICASLLVDPKDFRKRVDALAKRGYLVLEEANPDIARLGVEGYNALHSDALPKRPAKKPGRKRKEKPAEEKAAKEEQKRLAEGAVAGSVDAKAPVQTPPPSPQETQKPAREAAPQAPPQEAQQAKRGTPGIPMTLKEDRTIDIPYNPLIHGPTPPAEAAPAAQPPQAPAKASAQPEIDLVEVFEKYGVKKKHEIKEKLGELSKAIGNKPLSTTLATIAKDGKYESDEKCDLCKASFRLSLGKDNHPKYGHCFCGAAYHKDCYDTLLDNEGRCVRCGKKLVLMLDKQSEEAVKAVRALFE